MAEEQEAVRCLEAFHKGEARLSSLSTIAPRINVYICDVYSCEPWELPDPVNMDQNKKLYYLMNATNQVMTHRGPSRKTPRGHWKSKEAHRIISGTAHGFKQRFTHISGETLGKNIKWAMIEYTLYPPKSKENKFALCYVYRTKQDGRQKNGRPHDICLWNFPYQTCDDLELREEHTSKNLPHETYDELDLDYNGNDFPFRLGGT